MSSLKARIADGFAAQGLEVTEDLGNLVVRGGAHTATVSVDETDRAARAEEVLCYPVDDFSDELCRAMDHLNQRRVGVTYFYREAQRAIVAATVWTSPSRNPSANQLHLLVALLHEAKDLDAAPLARVAEGDASWEEVVDREGSSAISHTSTESAGGGALTSKFVRGATARYDVFAPPEPKSGSAARAERGEPGAGTSRRSAERTSNDHQPAPAPSGDPAAQFDDDFSGWESVVPGSARNDATVEMSPDELAAAAPRRGEERPPPPPEEPQRTSRHALHLAVAAVDERAPERVDLTEGRRSLSRRLAKWTAILVVVLGVGFVVLDRMVLPFFPTLNVDLGAWFAEATQTEDERELARRRRMTPGADLLALELERPLESVSYVGPSLKALGDGARATLETFVIQSPTGDARRRAYELWVEEGYGTTAEARLTLLKQMYAAELPDGPTVTALLNELQAQPPTDEEAIAALEWAQGSTWRYLLERLSRPGEGAERRAAALTKYLDRDGPDALVLLSLIGTGHAPPDAVVKLVNSKKLAWAQDEGKPVLKDLIRRSPAAADELLGHKQEDLRLFAIELLAEGEGPDVMTRLLQVARERERPLRERLRALFSLGKLGAPASTWPLVIAANRRDEDPAFREEARRVLRKLPEQGAVADLMVHLGPDRKPEERHYAVLGLSDLRSPAAIGALLEVLEHDEAVPVRRLAMQVLEELQKDKTLAKSLDVGIAVFRQVARSDADAQVSSSARRLYKALTGHDP